MKLTEEKGGKLISEIYFYIHGHKIKKFKLFRENHRSKVRSKARVYYEVSLFKPIT
jgi:hypothetical protein